MKTLRYICSTLICAILMAMPLSACSDDPADIYTEVEMLLAAPNDELIQIVRPDNGEPTTFLKNVNNNRIYNIPTFIDNRANVRLEKGVYTMAFDGEAIMPDGTARRVRMLGHSVMKDAMTFNNARETITLTLIFL